MHRYLIVPVLFIALPGVAYGRGMLIPKEPELPPLAMLNHHVNVTLDEQVAITRIDQTFRNHTKRPLEATYVFPVPADASVRDFAIWVGGRRRQGELLQADQAESMYTSIVRQTKNPALLDYIGSDLLSLKVFPVPPEGELKIEVSFTAVAKKEHNLVEYVYPLKTDRMATSTLEEFRLKVALRSEQSIGSIYSPTHEVTINQVDDHQAVVQFERIAAPLDRDFRLFYTTSGRDIELTALEHRPIAKEDGHVMLLLSPRTELSNDQKVPRDIVFLLDTSGSMMEDKKMDQAKKAVRHCLGELSPDDRFGLIQFASTVNLYCNELTPAGEDQVKHAMGWVAGQYAGGGTAIHQALVQALAMRGDEDGRMFTVVFFTDGQPTVGETDVDKILADITAGKSANTRIFSFGLGNDLNAVFLDQIAEQTRAVSRYVRPGEDLEAKVTSFFGKISRPVLAGLRLTTTNHVRLIEVFPPQLPDLFHGDQLVVLARYQGAGHAAIVLQGNVGLHEKEFSYDIKFAGRAEGKPFVEELWARRKVGYLLDQIRINGEQRELVDEVVRLAEHYGITTPYTSHLIMPDVPVQVAVADGSGGAGEGSGYFARRDAPALAGRNGEERRPLDEFARGLQWEAGKLAGNRAAYQDRAFDEAEKRLAAAEQTAGASSPADDALHRIARAKELKGALDLAQMNLASGNWRRNQMQKLGVDLAVCTNELKCQTQLQATAIRNVASRRCMEIGGVWIDEAFTAQTTTLAVKAQSDGYFRLLQRQPQLKEVFRLGNHLVWIAPNGTALVIDTKEGKDQLTNAEIDSLFATN